MNRLLTRELRTCDPCHDPAWRGLAERLDGDVFHAPAWLRALRRGYGLAPVALLVPGPDGAPRSGLATCELDDALGRRSIALPFSDYADPLLGAGADWEALVDTWPGADRPGRIRCLRGGPPLADRRLEETGQAWWHAVDLDRGEEELWSALHSTARRNVARARRAGVAVAPATDRVELRAFFEMHVELRRTKYRLLAQPWAFFEALWEEFVERDAGTLLLARLDGRPVAGILLLEAFGKLYYKFNASAPGALEARPNDLLVWEALRLGRARGLRHLDFGVSDLDQPGLARYKRKFGAREARVVTLRRAGRPEPDARACELRGLLGRLTDALTAPDVPAPVCERAGALLYGYFA